MAKIETNARQSREREHGGGTPEAARRPSETLPGPEAQSAERERQASNESLGERESSGQPGMSSEFEAHAGAEGVGGSLQVKTPGGEDQARGENKGSESQQQRGAERGQREARCSGPGNVQMRLDPQRGTGVVSWNANPFALMRTWTEQIDRMFDEFWRSMSTWQNTPVASADLWSTLGVPPVRTQRRNGKIEVVADLPGVDREALEVSLDQNVLTIAGERHDEEEGSAAGVKHTMQRYGRFERTVMLPNEIDASQAQATLKNGVLRVSLPIATSAHGKRIEVRAE